MDSKKYKKIIKTLKDEELTTSKDFVKKLKQKLRKHRDNLPASKCISFEESLDDYYKIINEGET